MSNRQAREARPVKTLANFGILALEFTTEEWIAPHQGQLIRPPPSAGVARLATDHHRNVSLIRRMSGSASRSGAKRARLLWLRLK
jgi:hypothetical protein